MARLILIHGSWHWSGCFHKLEPLLKAAGHDVVSVDNASHGDDQTAWDAIDSMATYNARAIEALNASDEPAVLVGHSMGGATLSHLADIMPEKISKLIFISGFMTVPGKTANDYILAHAENPDCAPLWAVLSPVNEWAGIKVDVNNPEQVKEAFYADCSDEDIANIYAPQTVAAHDRHYIKCTKDRAIPLKSQEEMIAEIPGTKTYELESSHSPFYSQPDKVAGIINGIC